jgi:tetratricopeptide (TPR) repeat protein
VAPAVPAGAGDAGAGRVAARREFDQGTAAEGANDLTSALQHFQAARRLDGTYAEAQQAITRVTARMSTEGNEAFVRARQYDALDRTDQAITWYERAYRSLPDDNPNRRVARERLDALRRR